MPGFAIFDRAKKVCSISFFILHATTLFVTPFDFLPRDAQIITISEYFRTNRLFFILTNAIISRFDLFWSLGRYRYELGSALHSATFRPGFNLHHDSSNCESEP
jgi:hypothetical protein